MIDLVRVVVVEGGRAGYVWPCGVGLRAGRVRLEWVSRM